jgi:putative peptidoglycan lipid II flippase
VLAAARESVSAALYGTGIVASAYRVSQTAFLIPLQGLMSEALTSGFTPVYARQRQIGKSDADVLLGVMQLILLACTVLIAIVLAIFAQAWVELLAPGFNRQETLLATRMVQILGLAMPPYALTALYAAAELAAGRPSMAASRPTVQSLALIGGTVAAWLTGQPLLIPVGFCVAYTLLTIWGIRSALANGIEMMPRKAQWPSAHASLVRVWAAYRMLIPIPLLMQVHFVIERRLASVVNSRAVAALDYARFISDTAVLLLATPFALAGLATMATLPDADFEYSARKAVRILALVGIPLSAAVTVHGRWLVRIAYARGAFDTESIAVTASILQTLALGIWAQLIGYAGARFLSAQGKNRQVLQIYAAAIGTNIALNLLLGRRLGAEGLGLASAANSVILGIAVLYELRALKYLSSDLATLALISCTYAALWRFVMPARISIGMFAPPICFAIFWGGAFALISPLRKSMLDVVKFLRRP